MADKTVDVTLAHPLRSVYAAHYGLEEKDYAVGDVVTVGTGGARDLAAAGYAAGVEPEKPEQVAALLATATEVEEEAPAKKAAAKKTASSPE
jgi:hypothetical protein